MYKFSKKIKKFPLTLICLISIVVFSVGCGSSDSNSSTGGGEDSIITSQTFSIEIDDGNGYANWTLYKQEDGSITGDGNFTNKVDNSEVFCPFVISGSVTVENGSLSFTATGEATTDNLQIPDMYRTSDFELKISTDDSGLSGEYSISFTQIGWSKIFGTFTVNQIDGEDV